MTSKKVRYFIMLTCCTHLLLVLLFIAGLPGVIVCICWHCVLILTDGYLYWYMVVYYCCFFIVLLLCFLIVVFVIGWLYLLVSL